MCGLGLFFIILRSHCRSHIPCLVFIPAGLLHRHQIVILLTSCILAPSLVFDAICLHFGSSRTHRPCPILVSSSSFHPIHFLGIILPSVSLPRLLCAPPLEHTIAHSSSHLLPLFLSPLCSTLVSVNRTSYDYPQSPIGFTSANSATVHCLSALDYPFHCIHL